MANITELASWEDGVYQIEKTDPVEGGPTGIANRQAQQLANRTAFLKKQIDDAVSGALNIGTAAKWKTARSISISGDANWSVTLDGSANVTAALTLASVGTAGTYPVVTTDAKGRVVSGRALQSADLPASPALTGTPTAPTAAVSTNTTQLANTAFVQAAIAALVASSPAALDTLQELATALGNDPNFATTMTNALAAKAPLASPVLTGNPTAPTAAAGASTTQLATTAFVQQEIAGDLATAAPLMDGTAAVGASTKLARENHVHPTDITRAPLASPSFSGTATFSKVANSTLFAASGGAEGGEFRLEKPVSGTPLTGDLTVDLLGDRFRIFDAGGTNKGVYVSIADKTSNAGSRLLTELDLTSPVLTGTPTAPTAAVGTNNTQLANTAFVQAAIAALVASSPAALDTLKELADALGNDPSFAVTMTNALAAKAPLASPTFTGRVTVPEGTQTAPGITFANDGAPDTGFWHISDGVFGVTCNGVEVARFNTSGLQLSVTPTAPTAIAGTNTTQLATTAFVQQAVGTGQVAFFAQSAAPAGWIKANGAAVSRTAYPALFAAIGTTYGAGDGSTTFNLPDLRGEFMRGWDDGRGVDSGRGIGSFQSDAQQRVQGTVGYIPFVAQSSAAGAFSLVATGVVSNVSSGTQSTTFTVNYDNAIVARTAAENRPRNIALLACIKL